MDDKIVDAEDIWFKYEDEWVINNESLSIANGEVISIVGSNGSGKTTLSKLLVGELTPDRGEIYRTDNFSYTIRYQDYSKNLLPWYSARYNYKLASNDEDGSMTNKWFEVGNYERWKDQKVSSLSGGQKQILSILCTLVMPADCIVLDEPFSAIDPERKSQLWDVLYEWQKELDVSVIVISHLIDEAISLADRLMVMKSGRHDNTIYKKKSNRRPSKYLSTKEADQFRKKVSQSFYGISDT